MYMSLFLKLIYKYKTLLEINMYSNYWMLFGIWYL